MPNGLWYCSGPVETAEIKPGSAFSKGDLLALDSNSSLSRLNPYAVAAGTIYGVATCDSTQSIKGLCSVMIPLPNTVLWSRGTAGDNLVRGEESGISFVAASPGRYFVDESTTTNVVVVVKGTADIDQSVESKVQVRLKYADSELVLS